VKPGSAPLQVIAKLDQYVGFTSCSVSVVNVSECLLIGANILVRMFCSFERKHSLTLTILT
jgi:hypothetical protein